MKSFLTALAAIVVGATNGGAVSSNKKTASIYWYAFKRKCDLTKLAISIAALALLVAAPAAALQGPLFYECDITKRNKSVGWISSKLGVIVTKDGAVLVTDAVIQNFFDEPQPARIRSRGDKLIVDWTLSALTDSASQNIPKFGYRATINTKTNEVLLKAKPVGFPQSWTGRGTCVSRTK